MDIEVPPSIGGGGETPGLAESQQTLLMPQTSLPHSPTAPVQDHPCLDLQAHAAVAIVPADTIHRSTHARCLAGVFTPRSRRSSSPWGASRFLVAQVFSHSFGYRSRRNTMPIAEQLVLAGVCWHVLRSSRGGASHNVTCHRSECMRQTPTITPGRQITGTARLRRPGARRRARVARLPSRPPASTTNHHNALPPCATHGSSPSRRTPAPSSSSTPSRTRLAAADLLN